MKKTEFSLSKLASIKEALEYDPDSGIFRWKVNRNSFSGKAKIGAVAGTIKDGYVIVVVDQVSYRAHILAWWFMVGEPVPKSFEIDHRNRKRSDNRWENLRLIKRSRNNHNANPTIANKSGVRGVSWVSRDNKWDARISFEKKVYVLGKFEKFEDAVQARRNAELHLLNEFSQREEAPKAPLSAPDRRPTLIRTETDRLSERRKKSLTKRSTNTSGHVGVVWHKRTGTWFASIVVNYRTISLGYHKDISAAVAARKEAEIKYLSGEK